MGITELISKVGDENCTVQFLHSSMVTANIKNKAGLVTFATDQGKVMDLLGSPKFVCAIVWMPRDVVEQVSNQ